MQFVPHCILRAVTCGDGKVRVWDIKTGGLKRVI